MCSRGWILMVLALAAVGSESASAQKLQPQADSFLKLLDETNLRTAYRTRLCALFKQQGSEELFVAGMTPLILQRQGAPKSRVLVEERVMPPMPNVTGGPVSLVRFKTVYPAGSVYEDVYVQQMDAGGTCVAAFYVNPAPF
jgi:hypothetical protein